VPAETFTTDAPEPEHVALVSDALDGFDIDVDNCRTELLTQRPEAVVERLRQGRGKVPQVPAALAIDAVLELPGRPALAFATWARDHAAGFR
jgi:hypothetical protein